MPLNSARYIHLLAEIEKRVFADRADYLGDPDFTQVPEAQLIAPTTCKNAPQKSTRRRSRRPNRCGRGWKPTKPPTSIVDAAGNAVSNTYTLNWDFGSGVVVKGAGFLLNDEMDDFSAKPGVANAFGVVGSDANAIEPGKRMLSSMSPTIITRNGEVSL